MAKKVEVIADSFDNPSQCTRELLVEQILWQIRLRWFAVAGIVAAVFIGSSIFPILTSTWPIYICAGALLLSNAFYFWAATKRPAHAGPRDIVLGMIQSEADLVILTAVLHFSGGVVNPFFLFYIFHIVIATIILPRNMSFAVGLTAISLFGLLAVNGLEGGRWLGYYPLQLSAVSGLWRNPVYVLSAFVAFVCTVVFVQYLTRMIIVRMTAKELEAARNNDVLKAVISAMAEGLIFITSDGNIAICNPAAEQWEKTEHAARSAYSFENFPPVLTAMLKSLTNVRKAAGVGQVIKFKTPGSQQRHIEAKSSSVVGIDGQQLGYVIVGQDLTEHKKLEKDLLDQTEQVTAINEMLKMSRIEMAQREKMVAIGQMATGIAHEIGNPLTSLSSVAQYLGRKLTKHEDKEHLLVIEHQVHRISNILKRMLSLSRPATVEYKWTDLNDLIDNTLSLIKFDKRVRSVIINNVSNSDLPLVWLNPQLFEQVLLNIFINAFDALNAKQGDDIERVLEVTREHENGIIEIRIRDTGIGMSPQIARRAFESFFTTKEIGKGTGLGLFISFNLVTEIDGTITLESEPDKGTTVIIRIPIRPKKDLIAGDDDQSDYLDIDKAAGKRTG
jgi:signal transduction histidine kinase